MNQMYNSMFLPWNECVFKQNRLHCRRSRTPTRDILVDLTPHTFEHVRFHPTIVKEKCMLEPQSLEMCYTVRWKDDAPTFIVFGPNKSSKGDCMIDVKDTWEIHKPYIEKNKSLFI